MKSFYEEFNLKDARPIIEIRFVAHTALATWGGLLVLATRKASGMGGRKNSP